MLSYSENWDLLGTTFTEAERERETVVYSCSFLDWQWLISYVFQVQAVFREYIAPSSDQSFDFEKEGIVFPSSSLCTVLNVEVWSKKYSSTNTSKSVQYLNKRTHLLTRGVQTMGLTSRPISQWESATKKQKGSANTKSNERQSRLKLWNNQAFSVKLQTGLRIWTPVVIILLSLTVFYFQSKQASFHFLFILVFTDALHSVCFDMSAINESVVFQTFVNNDWGITADDGLQACVMNYTGV